MSLDTVFRKPYDVQQLDAPDGAEGINQDFDAIFLALTLLRDYVNTAESTLEAEIVALTAVVAALAAIVAGLAHTPLLDGDVHDDTVAHTPVKGDLVVGNATPAWDALAVGADTFVLTADAAQPKGVKWAAPAAGTGTVDEAFVMMTTGI